MEESKSTLIAHVDSDKVSYESLKDFNPPQSTQTWRPVAHLELVDSLKCALNNHGYVISKEEYAVSKTGYKLFGTLDLDSELVTGIKQSIGFRHSNDKALSIQVVAGGRVFVCDNLALHGSITVIKHKHTWGFNLRDTLDAAIGNAFADGINDLRKEIVTASETSISDQQARAILAKSLYDGTVTFMTFKTAYDLYFERAVRLPAEYPDCAPRTVFGLHNAFTRALKLSSANVAFESTIELSRTMFQVVTEEPISPDFE